MAPLAMVRIRFWTTGEWAFETDVCTHAPDSRTIAVPRYWTPEHIHGFVLRMVGLAPELGAPVQWPPPD